MDSQVNTPAKWLKYLLYVEIAGALNFLGVYSVLGPLAGWVVLAINAVSVYLLFVLAEFNPRYKTAAILYIVATVITQFGIALMSLAGIICNTVGQYQEYNGHSEMIGERDAKLAGRWRSLFWLELLGSLALGAVIGLVGAVFIIASGSEPDVIKTVTSVASVGVAFVLRVLYLVYLHRTTQLLENEIVM